MFSKKSSAAGYVKRLWSSEEDDILKTKVRSSGPMNWDIVSESLPGRSGRQCRARWHSHLRCGIKKGDWTSNEDFTILSAHAKIGNQWSNISKLLEGRTQDDVKNRFCVLRRSRKQITDLREYDEWNQSVHSSLSKPSCGTEQFDFESCSSQLLSNFSSTSSRASFNTDQESCSTGYTKRLWSSEEDSILVNIMASNEHVNWNTIAVSLPGRTGKQCRERWHNHLRSGIKKGDWTPDEDKTILSSHAQLGNQWSKISKLLNNRVESDIKNRLNTLRKIHKLNVDEVSRSTSSSHSKHQSSSDPSPCNSHHEEDENDEETKVCMENVMVTENMIPHYYSASSLMSPASEAEEYTKGNPADNHGIRWDVEEIVDAVHNHDLTDQDILDILAAYS